MMGGVKQGEGEKQLMICSISHHLSNSEEGLLLHGHVCVRGTGSLVFADHVAAEKSSRMSSEVYKAALLEKKSTFYLCTWSHIQFTVGTDLL